MSDKELLQQAILLLQSFIDPFRDLADEEIAPQLQETVALGSTVLKARALIAEAEGAIDDQARVVGTLPLDVVALDESGSNFEIRYNGFPVGRMNLEANSMSALTNGYARSQDDGPQRPEPRLSGNMARGTF